MKPRISKQYDIRPIDFQSGKRLAIPESEQKICQCCGKHIVKINELSTGHIVGDECATSIKILGDYNVTTWIGAFQMGCTKKQFAFYQGISK